LFFVAQKQGNNKASTVVLALDRRTGEMAYENELIGTVVTQTEAVVDASKHTVSLAISGQGSKTLIFQFTDLPRPPQPPAQTGEMASSSVDKQAGTLEPSLGAAIEMLQRGFVPGGMPVPNIIRPVPDVARPPR
jgi:hypothetical protein